MMKDLGSLSDPARLTVARSGAGSATLAAAEQRWRWLLPWTWILGAWSGARERSDFVLDVTVRGAGLDTCSSVQVGRPHPTSTCYVPLRQDRASEGCDLHSYGSNGWTCD